MKARKSSVNFEVIMVDEHRNMVLREVVSGWRKTVIRAKNLRGRNPKAHSIMVVAVF
jgi:hypothetical protein